MVVGCLLLSLAGQCASTRLIPPDASWRYLPVRDDRPPGWMAVDFNDVPWPESPAGFSFGFLGYQQGATLLPPALGLPPRAVLLRHQFTVDDPSQVLTLLLRIEYEDGLRGWLNGREIVRRGFPPEVPVVAADVPEPHPMGEAELVDLTAWANLLVSGTNVFALEVTDAQSAAGSLFVWPELRANFVRGPMVQNITTNQAIVVWRVLPGIESWLETTAPGEPTYTTNAASNGLREYVALLSGLEPGTRYSYVVVARLGERQIKCEPASFSTLRLAGDTDFLVIGDTGSGHLGEHLVARMLNSNVSTDFLLHVGDIVYPAFTEGRSDLRCFSEYEPLLRQIPFFPTTGNHEMYGKSADYLGSFWLPTNSVTGTEFYYSFDHGDLHVTSLLVPWWGISELGKIAEDGSRSAQYRWLTNDLAQTAKPWKVVFFHQPPLSSGEHALDDYDLDGRLDALQMQEFFLPLFEKHQVQVVFTGHDHLWERFPPTNGIHFVVTGGGGALRYQPTHRNPASAQVISRFHVTHVRVEGDEMRIEAIEPDGRVMDQFSIRRAAPAIGSLIATWHSPAEPPSVPNLDGNQVGELFDVDGSGVSGVSGLSANPGRIVVNHDAAYVHLGLRDVMLQNGETLAIFVSATNVAGVGSLSGIGGEREHPFADASLTFKEFEPFLVCLLGDEFADGTDPEFVRYGSEIPLGQGVFELNASLTSVTTARIRQFNRSPEGPGIAAEQNADFAVVSMPRSMFAGVLPGQKIQLGGVVMKPTRTGSRVQIDFDTSFIGRSLTSDNSGTVTLTPVEFTLADPPDGDFDLDGLGSDEELAHGTNPRDPDTDSDGLPDGWEVRSGLVPTRSEGTNGAEGDPDRDGYSNREEFLSGTDPQDASPTLRLGAEMGNDGLRLTWRSIIGRTYDVETAERLTDPFRPGVLEGFPRRATSTNESVELKSARPLAGNQWYRIREQ